jgi:hypothetical protein
MAVAYVQVTHQQEDQDNASTSWSLLEDVNPTLGNRLVGIYQNEDGLANNFADAFGNTWSKILDMPSSIDGTYSTIWTAHLTGDPNTITVTKNAAGERPQVASVIEVSGVASVSPVDVTVTNSGTGTSMSTGTTAATAEADSLAIAFWVMNDNAAVSAHTNSFTEATEAGTLGGGASTPHQDIAYKVLSGTGTQECTATRAAGVISWRAAMVVLKGTGGGAAAPGVVRTFNAIPFMGRMGR